MKAAPLFAFLFALGSLVGGEPAGAQNLTVEEGVRLLQRFLPDQVVQERQKNDQLEHGEFTFEEMVETLSDYKNHSDAPTRVSYVGPFWNYFELPYGGPGRPLVLLYWCETSGEIWWRLVGRAAGGDFSLIQEAEGWYETTPYDLVQVRLADLDGDGTPELLLFSGESYSMTTLFAFRWQDQRLVRITPRKLYDIDGPYSPEIVVSEMGFDDMENSGIHLADLDEDGKAEIIVGPDREKVYKYDAEGNRLEDDITWRSTTPTRIFRMVNGVYELWREAPPDDPYPISVPSIGAFHPSTLPLSELSHPGNGKMRVFVSHPAGTATVDDYETGQFRFQGTALPFKKRWSNEKQPDTASANYEWDDCPVKQAAKEGRGEWQVNPSDPALPSPDGKTEYHFVGPYLELEIGRSAVFPYLLEAATAAFARDPQKETTFVEVPLKGRMKNGKLAVVRALACIRKTGPSAPAPAAAPEPAPTPPKRP